MVSSSLWLSDVSKAESGVSTAELISFPQHFLNITHIVNITLRIYLSLQVLICQNFELPIFEQVLQ